MHTSNDWFYEYFINEVKAIGRKPTSSMQYEVVDSLPSSGNEQTIYFVKNNSSSTNDYYDEYVWISSSSTFEKIGSSQIDGSAANPDWNQNDATQPDYIKNRPFYTGDPVETVLVGESTVAFTENEGLMAATWPENFDLVDGQTYCVSWDGTDYVCTGIVFRGALPVLGNLGIAGFGDDTGEPFIFLNQGQWLVASTDSATEHVIGISEFAVEVVKIDAKYLPDNPLNITGATIGQIAKIAAVDDMGKPTAWEADTQILFKPDGKSYLTFSSPSSFTLKVKNSTKNWDGTLEYFSSDKTWTTWGGTSTVSAVTNDGEYVIYLRGTGNTVLTGSKSDYGWTLTGSNIACVGNIENLLDYTTVESGGHPTMASYCYASMFLGCTSLIQAPTLPATTLASYCYASMFVGCTSLIQAPTLPATTLTDNCYAGMFQNCTSLIQAPTLPATTLTVNCYMNMFSSCTSLTKAPALPATTLASYCYYSMFLGCTSLIQAPTLPATTLTDICYAGMFQNCTSLIQAPALPATTLTNGCYGTMFSGCTSLTKAPALPATTLADNCYMNMFSGCTSLIQVPALPAMTLVGWCYENMFKGCTSLKLSSTKTDEYTHEYRIPSSGNGATATNALRNMFGSTGGTFTGTPEINTTYYLSSENMIARDTEVATLNGYVDSMIDAALSKIGIAEEGAY